MCAMTLGSSTETHNGSAEHTPPGEYIYKTPIMSESSYLHAVPQRPEEIGKGVLKEFLTMLGHLNFT